MDHHYLHHPGSGEEEILEIAIVGGGICGLATALALHRKGIKSTVFERSEKLRASGATITILANGWHALDQIGVASKLRNTAIPLSGTRDFWLSSGLQKEIPLWKGEARCLKRSDLVKALAEDLPDGAIVFNQQIVSVVDDPSTSFPVLLLHDGRRIKAKVVIGCDGANSVVAEFLELKPTKSYNVTSVRGFTTYENGHGFSPEFLRVWADRSSFGRIPVDDKVVYWFLGNRLSPKDFDISKDQELIKQRAMGIVKDFPSELRDMVANCSLESLSLTELRYRTPWDLAFGGLRKGTVTVAGDALHIMGPFLQQGGSAGLEDAVVLARCLAPKLIESEGTGGGNTMRRKVGEGFDSYVKQRRKRLVLLSIQTYLIGSLKNAASTWVRYACRFLMQVLFKDPTGHTHYRCGYLSD